MGGKKKKKKKQTFSHELRTSLNIIQYEKDSAWLEQQFLSIFSLMTYTSLIIHTCWNITKT
jgi:hypothetical protein